MKLVRLGLLSAALIVVAFSGATKGQTAGTDNTMKPAANMTGNPTLENLMSAYGGEVSTHARYVEYAKKADEEGYHQVASMFRAVAHAEDIHASNFAGVLQARGETPKADVETPAVSSTRENLEAAIKDEDRESSSMYPQWVEQAHKDHDRDAERVFNYSKSAEASHAVIYRQALGDLESYRGGSERFMVCPKCGRACVALKGGKCPICSTRREEFLTIN